MPDTGAAAGQQSPAAIRLRRAGVPLSYANAAAFELAGWALSWCVAQEEVSFSYTLAPHPVAARAAEGWHQLVLTLVNGEGDLLIGKPTGAGWSNFPTYFRTRCEQTDHDDAYNAIQQGVGVNTAGDLATVVDYIVTDDDSLSRVFSADNAALALYGYDSTDLTNGTLTLEGSLRASDNAAGIPDAWLSVVPITADDGEDPTLGISWADYPSAVTSVQEGLDFPSTDPTDDDAQPNKVYLWQVRYVGTPTWTVTAIVTGLNGSFTIAGDHRKWFARGGSFSKTATGAAPWVVSSVSYAGGNTTITVTGTVLSGVVDGNLTVTIKQTLGKGTITAESRQVRP